MCKFKCSYVILMYNFNTFSNPYQLSEILTWILFTKNYVNERTEIEMRWIVPKHLGDLP